MYVYWVCAFFATSFDCAVARSLGGSSQECGRDGTHISPRFWTSLVWEARAVSIHGPDRVAMWTLHLSGYTLFTLESFVILILRFRVLVVRKCHLQHGYRPIATTRIKPGFWDITVPRPPFQAMTFCSMGPVTTIAWSAQHRRLFCVCLLPGCDFISSDILQVQSINTRKLQAALLQRNKGKPPSPRRMLIQGHCYDGTQAVCFLRV